MREREREREREIKEEERGGLVAKGKIKGNTHFFNRRSKVKRFAISKSGRINMDTNFKTKQGKTHNNLRKHLHGLDLFCENGSV